MSGTIVTLPGGGSQFGQIREPNGRVHTVYDSEFEPTMEVGDEVAYKVEIWGGDSSLAHTLEQS